MLSKHKQTIYTVPKSAYELWHITTPKPVQGHIKY